MAQDQVCFTNNVDKCDSYKFLLVDGGNELQKDQFSGIIGLAPPSSEEKSTVPAFISQFNNMFSFYLSKGSGSEGFLKIGDYDLEKYAKTGSKPEDIVWTSVIDDGWTIPLSAVQFHSGKTIDVKAEQLTLDTGLSYALVPPRDIESIIDVMK